MAETRIYVVTNILTKDAFMVEASHPAVALRHIADNTYAVDVATTKQVATMLQQPGQKVLRAGEKAAAE